MHLIEIIKDGVRTGLRDEAEVFYPVGHDDYNKLNQAIEDGEATVETLDMSEPSYADREYERAVAAVTSRATSSVWARSAWNDVLGAVTLGIEPAPIAETAEGKRQIMASRTLDLLKQWYDNGDIRPDAERVIGGE